MVRLENIFRLFELGRRIQELRDKLEAGAAPIALGVLGQELLEDLRCVVAGDFLPVEASKMAARQLHGSIKDIVVGPGMRGSTKNPNHFDVERINTDADKFQAALSEELRQLPLYFVTRVRAYSTHDLIERAEVALSEETQSVISDEAKRDFRQAGRSLAFEAHTASGYHSMRATESVLRQYHVLVSKKRGTWIGMKKCIEELTKAGANPRTMQVLDQIRNLHRNPIAHPYIFLEPEEAADLFEIAASAISAMAREIAILKAFPSSP